LSSPRRARAIIYDHGLDIWVMNDDGSGQHALIGALTVPGISDLDESAVDPNGTTLRSCEWINSNIESTRWNPDAPGACGANCEGVYCVDRRNDQALVPRSDLVPAEPMRQLRCQPAGGIRRRSGVEWSFANDPACAAASTGASTWSVPAFTTSPQPAAPGRRSRPVRRHRRNAAASPKPAVNPANAQQIAYADCHDASSQSDGAAR
jgi:hypothetical protein